MKHIAYVVNNCIFEKDDILALKKKLADEEAETELSFDKAVKLDELAEEKESLENIDRQDPHQIDIKYRLLPQVLDKLKPLDGYFSYIDDAIRYGFIALDHLLVVLAKDESYGEFLPKLWTKYQCDLRDPKEPDTATVGDRVQAWHNLLYRWAFGIVEGDSSGVNPVPHLPTHYFDQETGDLKKYNLRFISSCGHVPVVKLDDLRRYFTKTIGIPLPTRLFPVQGYENSISTKLSPNKSIPEKTLPFSPCESGTKWENIKITLIDNDTIRIETPKRNGLFSYHELGMSDKRDGSKPTQIWLLLKLFAKFTGRIDSKTDKYDPKRPDIAKRLNKHLKDLFGIKESIYMYHYKTHKAYITKLVFSDQTERTQFTNDALDS